MNRKELTRNYKETARPMGVFAVRNTVASKVFLGTSTDLTAILNRQSFALKSGGHPNRALQADWNALGAEAFTIEALDTLKPSEEPGYDPKDDLETLLRMWRETLGKENSFYD